MITAEMNRLPSAVATVRHDIEEHIQWLRRRLKDVDKDLYDGLKRSPLWRVKLVRLNAMLRDGATWLEPVQVITAA